MIRDHFIRLINLHHQICEYAEKQESVCKLIGMPFVSQDFISSVYEMSRTTPHTIEHCFWFQKGAHEERVRHYLLTGTILKGGVQRGKAHKT